jgi:organic hydroperoxide reductase OsmC/OhrA
MEETGHRKGGAAMNKHHYETNIVWTGNTAEGTKTYRSYSRNFTLTAPDKPDILGSSDPAFRGDRDRYNPEEMLVAALSSCHMLSYLHLCAINDVVVLAYEDIAAGTMQERPDGSGVFTHVQLNPKVTISAESNIERASELYHKAHELCFIANSVNFPVAAAPTVVKA